MKDRHLTAYILSLTKILPSILVRNTHSHRGYVLSSKLFSDVRWGSRLLKLHFRQFNNANAANRPILMIFLIAVVLKLPDMHFRSGN